MLIQIQKMVKIDFHIHSNSFDKFEADLSQNQIIDYYAKKGFSAISITEHDKLSYNKKMGSYAQKKGLLLIPGVEVKIKKGHVLIINSSQTEIKKKLKKNLPENFDDIKKIKTKNNLIIAAHPYIPWEGIGEKEFMKHKNLFDAVEYNGFAETFWFFKLNKKAKNLSLTSNKPLIGNSDGHFKPWYGSVYSAVDSKKTVKDIINNIKKGKLIVVKMLPKNFIRRYFSFFYVLLRELIKSTERFINHVIRNNNNG